jgi:radical SAM superfamily enzyme YgiQ (UPF0313 family)
MEGIMKLGFVAMSGVRAYDEELTRLGLTLPGFVERNKVIASLPSLGLLTLAGMTPQEFEVSYVEVPDINSANDVPGDFDAVAISSFTAQIYEAYQLAERYRSRGSKVILGGLHVSAVPEEAAQYADAVVVGEGECSWPKLLDDLRRGALKPRYDAPPEGFDLQLAPLPCFELLDPARYNRLTIQTQRGCPHCCEFCAASPLLTSHYKLKPVAKVVAEIERIQEIWPRPFVEFADDNTFVDKQHSKAMVRALAAHNIRWFTETDVSVADDEELLQLMHDSGCAQVLIGFESTCFAGLDGLERRSNWKARQLERYAAAIDRIQRHGITVNGCFILGLDHNGPESFDAVFDFVRTSGLYEVQVTVQTAFPGTPLYDRLRSSGRLLRESAWELCTLFDVNFIPQQMSAQQLRENFCALVQRLYSEDFTKERREKFHQRLRAARSQ